MFDDLRARIEDIFRAVRGDEDAFNRFAEAEGLGIHLRHGRVYPSAVGQSHTTRLVQQFAGTRAGRVHGR